MNERARQIADAPEVHEVIRPAPAAPSSRTTSIATVPDHVARSQLCTEAEWSGYLWWMHDRKGSPPAGGGDGIEAAKILIARDRDARDTP